MQDNCAREAAEYEEELAQKRMESFRQNHRNWSKWWDMIERHHDAVIEYMASEGGVPDDDDPCLPSVTMHEPIFRSAPKWMRPDGYGLDGPY